ncbi:MAG: DNA methyltransferase, partial [Candidatus Bipolaricaulia bacterium]
MKSKAILKSYFEALTDVARQGDAREESFYSCLEALLQQYASSTGRSEVHVTTIPRPTEAGNPDFRVWDGQDRIIGYIEAKNPAEEDLTATESSDQLKRYRETFPNLILTNFFEFRLYRKGELIDRVLAARPFIFRELGMVPPVERADELFELFEKFFEFSLPRSYTAESLAVELAKRTRFLREIVAHELQEEKAREEGYLPGFYEAFLRDLFQFISLGDLPKQLEWIVDDISQVLAVADAGGILERFYREGKGSDPIVHFYETFLREYDPEERERRGVYYTPEPVVSY